MPQPDEIGLRLLIIYQGDQASLFRDHAVRFLRNIPKDGTVSTGEVAFGGNSLSHSVLASFLKEVDACDAAIALVTEDPRAASTAGNLWFELGYWAGQKGTDKLLVMLQDKDELGKDRPMVTMISDLIGQVAPRFGKEKDMNDPLRAFVDVLRNKMFQGFGGPTHDSSGRYRNEKKIKDTLSCSSPNWTFELNTQCLQKPESKCIVNSSSLVFMSELMRMGRSNREASSIQVRLYVIGYLCDALIHLDYESESSVDQFVKRVMLMDALGDAIKELHDTANDLLVRSDANRPTPNHWQWERLEKYISHRVKKSSANVELFGQDLRAKWLVEAAGRFVNWMRKYADGYTQMTMYSHRFRPKLQENDPELEDLLHWGMYSLKIAKILDIYSSRYFESCRDVIKTRLGNTDLLRREGIWRVFGDICSEFPHNMPSPRFPEIWPIADDKR